MSPTVHLETMSEQAIDEVFETEGKTSEKSITFRDLNISEPVLRAINDMGFEKPSPIQAETLPILLGESTDFLGLAATGTGKTAAFSIPMLERIDENLKSVQALVLCPTRELALQVTQQINILGKYKKIEAVTIYGGASYVDQIRGLKRGAQVVVGTPGRIVDHLEQKNLDLSSVTTLILDEADEMISMGFKEELEKILASSPRESSQIWLFSATMSREVRRVADEYLRDPQRVQVNRKEMLPSTVEQYYYPVRESDKPEVLCKLIEAADDFYGLIFCQTKALVIDLTQYLIERGYKVDCLHGDKDQSARERTMQAFRDRKMKVLICTDVASRGLDVKDITHVINYSLPRELDNYVHRIGRTARSGKTGIAMNLVTPSHRGLIFKIENFTKTRMKEGQLPTRRDIAAKKVNSLLERFNDQPYFSRAVEIMSDEWKTALADLGSEEVAARFLTMMMPDIFNDRSASSAPPIRSETPQREAREKRERPQFVRERFERKPREERSLPFKRKSFEDKPTRTPGSVGNSRKSDSKTEKREQFKSPFNRDFERPPKKSASSERSSPQAPPELHPSGLNRKERRAAKFGATSAEAFPKKAKASGGDRPPRKKR